MPLAQVLLITPLLLLKALDGLTTYLAMTRFAGQCGERNRLARWQFRTLGLFPTLLLDMLIVLLIALLMARLSTGTIFLALGNLILLLVVGSNVRVLIVASRARRK